MIGEAEKIIEAYVSEEARRRRIRCQNRQSIDGLIKLLLKSGRAISTKHNKEKSDESNHESHRSKTQHQADHEKHTNDVIAALKELITSPQGGDEGEEQKQEEKSEATAPKRKVEFLQSGKVEHPRSNCSELEAYLFTQRLLRQAKSALDEGLRQNKEKLKQKFPSRR